MQAIPWEQETRRFFAPHDRLRRVARLLASMPHRRLLDVGCSAGMLRNLLPPDFDYYGCDITSYAAQSLDAEHFHQIDLNRSRALSIFAGRGIDVIHVGGVLEYLAAPDQLLAGARRLVEPGSALVVTIINFQSLKRCDPATHHPGWVFKPSLDELRRMLERERWKVERALPFLRPRGLRRRWASAVANRLGVDHEWTRRRARQFILVAQAA